MDIPSLMLSAAEEGNSFIAQAIKFVKVSSSESKEKELLNVWLELDCDKKKTLFVPFAYQKEKSERDFNYLGNNSAAATQIYAVRELSGILNYWTGRMNGILMNIQKFLPECDLKEDLKLCEEAGLYGEHGLCFDRMEGKAAEASFYQDESDKKKKGIKLDGELMSGEKWLHQIMGLSSHQKLMLVVPAIIKNGQRIAISSHPDYVNAIETFLGRSSGGGRKENLAVCHICGRLTDTIDTKAYSSKLDRYSISKVFVTTPINYAPQFQQRLHQKNFAICHACYEKWYSAEKVIMHDYKMKIAGEDAIVLFDGILDRLDRDDLDPLKKKIDIAFEDEKGKAWMDELTEDGFEEQEIDLYEFNLIFYKSDGKSCSIKKTIEDVSSIWFQTVTNAFAAVRKSGRYANILSHFRLGSIYRMIPVRVNEKKKEQLNIDRVLEFYAAILQQHTLAGSLIFEYFSEAMECGHREIMADEVRNTKNLKQLEYYHQKVKSGKIEGLEWYIQYMSAAYLALMKVLSKLHILENEVLEMDELSAPNVQNEGKTKDFIAEKEEFLIDHGFSEQAKGIYYVGAMMYQIGMMQYYQEHKTKPILEKVTYSGMSRRDMMELLNELHDKIRQYRGAMENKKKGYLIYYAERLAERAYAYLGNFPAGSNRVWDEHESLFYLMSGYSGCMQRNIEKSEEDEENASE